MAINLSKGQKVDLTKTNPGLTNVVVGLGWDVNKYDGGNDFDLDSSVFLLNGAGKCAS
jgi:tellurium resistance protein TerD